MNERAFTCEYNTISRRLVTEATVKYAGREASIVALWDTGATNICISKDVVAELSLVPLGKQKIHTPSGLSVVNTYMVDIMLPNQLIVGNVPVCDSEIGSQGIGALVGMDIINMGYLSISNFKGKTSFTFRTPSKEKADYVAKLRFQKVIGVKHGKGRKRKS